VTGFLLRPNATSEDRRAVMNGAALDILFRSLIASSLAQPADYLQDPALVATLTNFCKAVLGSAAGADDLGAVLAHVRSLHAQAPLAAEVVPLLSKTLAGTFKALAAQKDGSACAWKELAALSSPLAQARAAVEMGRKGKTGKKEGTRELFELRDKHAHVMDLEQQACLLLKATDAPATDPSALVTLSAPSESALVEAVLKGSLGVTSQAALRQKRRDIHAAKSDLQTVEQGLESDLRPFTEAVTQAQDALRRARARHEGLLQELAAVAAEVKDAEQHLQAKEAQVQAQRAGLEKSVTEKDRRLQGMLADVQRADAADALASKVRTLVVSLSQALSRTLASVETKRTTQHRERLRRFAAAFEPYLEVEIQCVDFLKGRIAALEADRARDVAELRKFQAMAYGLPSTIDDLVKKTEDETAFIAQDTALLQQLLGATNELYLTFRAAVEEAGGPGAEWMVREDTGLSLINIKQLLERLSLAQDWLPGLSSTGGQAAPSPTLSADSFPASPSVPFPVGMSAIGPPSSSLVSTRHPQGGAAAQPASSSSIFSMPPVAPTPLLIPNTTTAAIVGPPGLSNTSPPAFQPQPQNQHQQRPPRNPGPLGPMAPGQSLNNHVPSPQQHPPQHQQQPSQAPPSRASVAPSSAPPVKFTWANRLGATSSASPPGLSSSLPTAASPSSSPSYLQPHKSLVQIQEEERQSQIMLTEENLRRLEQSKADSRDSNGAGVKGNRPREAGRGEGGREEGRDGGGAIMGSSEAAEVNSMTDRTLGAVTVSSEGLQELPSITEGLVTGGAGAVAVEGAAAPGAERNGMEEEGLTVQNGGVA
jgi:hypothetical protein